MALSINFEFDKMISNSRMQITLVSFLFKKFNIKKGINIKDTLKLYAVLFSCFIYAKLPKAVGFKYLKQTYLR
jgi:hypothetical protein